MRGERGDLSWFGEEQAWKNSGIKRQVREIRMLGWTKVWAGLGEMQGCRVGCWGDKGVQAPETTRAGALLRDLVLPHVYARGRGSKISFWVGTSWRHLYFVFIFYFIFYTSWRDLYFFYCCRNHLALGIPFHTPEELLFSCFAFPLSHSPAVIPQRGPFGLKSAFSSLEPPQQHCPASSCCPHPAGRVH